MCVFNRVHEGLYWSDESIVFNMFMCCCNVQKTNEIHEVECVGVMAESGLFYVEEMNKFYLVFRLSSLWIM